MAKVPTTIKDAIRAPLQARSRETMDRIMGSLEALLKEKTFDKITMIELAQHSGTGTSSIYARFKDKRALILGMHMRVREQALACLAQLSDPEHWHSKSVEEIVSAVVNRALPFYHKHGPLIRAALYVDDVNVRERQASVLRIAAQQFSEILISRSTSAPERINTAIDGACQIFTSTIYMKLMFGEVSLARSEIPERIMRKQVVIAMSAILNEALSSNK